MSASERGRRGGQPSTTAPMAAPWDSPQVVTRKSWPKVFPMWRDQDSRGIAGPASFAEAIPAAPGRAR